ncbi:hypothetical protein ACFLRW_00995 [Acidobacteriota bacterium]
MNKQRMMFLIKFPYWLGIAADAFWAAVLLFPPIFGLLMGEANFNPELQVKLIMGIGGTLMTGWTVLLLWAVRKPVERRSVILITAFPVVFGMFVIALIGFIGGSLSNLWILIKSSILILTMVTSYVLAGQISKNK